MSLFFILLSFFFSFFLFLLKHIFKPTMRRENRIQSNKWKKNGIIYLDGKNEKQSADTFNGTLLYVVIMLLLTIFNDRIIGWIGATVFYLIWKSSKYN